MSRAGLLVVLAVLAAVPAQAHSPPELDGSAVVRGHLLDEATGAGLEGEPVELRWIPPESTRAYPYPWTPMDGSRRPHVVAETTSGEGGRFGFEGLVRGLYQIHVELPLAGDVSVLEVAGEGTHHALVTVRVGRMATGRVLRPDGTPASGARVFLAGVEDGQGGNARWNVEPLVRTARADGTFSLPGLPEGRCWLEAWHDDLGFSAPAAVDDRDVVELVMRDEKARLYPLERTRFGGVGISVSRDAIGPYVASVSGGGAAARAGVAVGDRIAAVDGLGTVWMPFDELLMRCRGPAGHPVVLTLVRGEERSDVEIVRELFE